MIENAAVASVPPFAAEAIVTVFAVFQVFWSNVSVVGVAVRSALPPVRATFSVTGPAGRVASFTPTPAEPPCLTRTVDGVATTDGAASTRTATGAETVAAPRLSIARAVTEYSPAVAPVQVYSNGAVVSEPSRVVPA